jgi:hypothetical protein
MTTTTTTGEVYAFIAAAFPYLPIRVIQDMPIDALITHIAIAENVLGKEIELHGKAEASDH